MRVFYRIIEKSDGKRSTFDVYRVEDRGGWFRPRVNQTFLTTFPTLVAAKKYIWKQPGTGHMKVVNVVGDFLPSGHEINLSAW